MKGTTAFSRLISLLMGCLIIGAVFSVLALRFLNTAPSFDSARFVDSSTAGIELEESGSLVVTVYPGESAQALGARFERYGLIRSRYAWSILARLSKETIKAGTYRLSAPSEMLPLWRMIVAGRQLLERITIPEGYTMKKTALLLERYRICGVQEFMAAASDPEIIAAYGIPAKTLEGYLFPETYDFPRNCPPKLVVQAMLDTFFRSFAAISGSKLSPQQIFNSVILASIIEREYRVESEAPMIASVFHNRLASRMRFESCATVEYILTEIEGRPHPERLTYDDIAIDNPYNTYLRSGLPPGPICSPGKVALNAALHPAESPYFFFRLVDPDSGTHAFSRNLEQHVSIQPLYTKRQAATP